MQTRDHPAIKKVVITRNAYKWQYGGAEQFTYNLARVLEAEGAKTVVVTRVPELLRHCHSQNISTFKNIWFNNETHRRWMLAYYLLWPLLVGQYAWLLWREQADLLVASSRDDQIFGTMAAKLLGVPVVWFDHADMKHIVAQPFRFLSRSYYWALRTADRVVMTSEAEHAKVSAHYPIAKQSNFVTILNGAFKGKGKALARPAGKQIVVYVGRLDRDKGIFDLAEAAVQVLAKAPETEFWLVGKGPFEAQLKAKLAELGVDQQVKLLGHFDNVWDVLSAADIFVYPTHHDAAPLAPVEALLAGVPVVASRVGGIPEMVPESAGCLVEPHDPVALAAALTNLLIHPTELKRLRNGAKAAGPAREFTTITKQQYLPLFTAVIKERLR